MVKVEAASEPRTEAELWERARALAGSSLGELAARRGVAVPETLRRAKGFVGGLIEQLLGASAASRASPDFPGLGIELKTLPVDGRGRPVESTFVCTISFAEVAEVSWHQSRAYRKLARVLWVPVEGERTTLVNQRRVGEPLLWSPSAGEEACLRCDWEELAGLIGRGEVESISGRLGTCLQVRPKAANSRSRRLGHDADGAPVYTLPRGFYLRASFTARILAHNYVLPRSTRAALLATSPPLPTPSRADASGLRPSGAGRPPLP